MIGLRLTFTAGRYHATGWDHHVNEGVAEWPPAPWRILRALVAASYRLADHERGGVSELLERLTPLPVYRLPAASTAHLRHYMPTDNKPVKVLDTFVAVGDGARAPAEVLVWWPGLELTDPERELLGRLLQHVAYLGRAESWVEIAVADVDESQTPNARPQAFDEPANVQTVRLLTVQSTEELAAWRERWLEAVPAKGKGKSPTPPASVWDVLNVSTAELQRERWSQAPGSCWVDYRLEEPPRVRPRARRAKQTGPSGAVFLLESAVRPSADQTLVIAERMRSTVMALANKRTGAVPWQFSGKDHNDAPLTGHEHAYFLPLARRDRDGRELIDRVLIWARDGFAPDTWASLQQLAASGRRLRGQADEHPLELILAGYGGFDQLRALLPVNAAHPLEGSWLGPSRTWVSATPFVPPRFTKSRRNQLIDTPEDQLRWLLREVLGVPEHEVSEIETEESKDTFGWSRFVRVRKKDRSRTAARAGSGFRITFTKPVCGPIALGYGAHFGLGLFRPA
ncbi:hypothetical protein DB30_06550 [Enhygromyxa salina]|uniref:Type I-U CRISPR-associated protein Cas5/Cas6 n=1 Tax=Enhygromyxa salina TaxID=215803 RepID=A0A0C1ZN90_9BACT|nr:type I-U CRISPR-associated protein Csb2 [Enhygromyxa salina]KIG18939.1 hypothetical protein DB30_06550 [Enhygromyxa salina]